MLHSINSAMDEMNKVIPLSLQVELDQIADTSFNDYTVHAETRFRDIIKARFGRCKTLKKPLYLTHKLTRDLFIPLHVASDSTLHKTDGDDVDLVLFFHTGGRISVSMCRDAQTLPAHVTDAIAVLFDMRGDGVDQQTPVNLPEFMALYDDYRERVLQAVA